MVSLLGRRREMMQAGPASPGTLLFNVTVSSAAASFYTPKFTSAQLAKLADAETLTVIVYPVLVTGDAAAQSIRVQVNNAGVGTKSAFGTTLSTLFAETADKSTYAKFIRPVKSEWDWASSTKKVHRKVEYTNSSGVVTTSTAEFTLTNGYQWSKFTTNYRFTIDNVTHYGVGTVCQVWLDLDPLWL